MRLSGKLFNLHLNRNSNKVKYRPTYPRQNWTKSEGQNASSLQSLRIDGTKTMNV